MCRFAPQHLTIGVIWNADRIKKRKLASATKNVYTMTYCKTISDRVEMLRGYMNRHGLDAFIIPTSDPHMSEYTPAHWQARQWISGFSGSAGTAVVTAQKAALWTDSRYFLAASGQLASTPFALMKDGLASTPSIGEWLAGVLNPGSVAGIDGKVVTPSTLKAFEDGVAAKHIVFDTSRDPFDELWDSRPALPSAPVETQPMEYAGESCRDKLSRMLAEARRKGCDALLLTALDDIAWALNLRGSDVECNPVFVSYLLVSGKSSTLFINPCKVSAEVREYLKDEGVDVKPYEDVIGGIKKLDARCTLLSDKANSAICSLYARDRRVVAPSVAERFKAVKNDAEIGGFHNAMLRDGVAMVKFLSRLHSEVEKGITETGADRLLTSLRAEQELYRGLSFPTIAAFGAHGAIVHYEADEDTDVKLEPRSFILIDSGAQYADGTTDITRTIALGTPTPEEKKVYTLVLKGHIALSRCVFPEGASGTQLDLAARYAMWQHLMNFGHGTGHGVGSYLNVHEGPHQIRMNHMPAPLRAGMTVTDEPGLYLEGKFGVRTENTLLIVPAGESEFGKFLKFEPLTLCPIDTAPIDFTLLDHTETEWLNDYHATVRERLMPLIDDAAAREWLAAATQPVKG